MFDDAHLSTHPVDVGIRSEGAILGALVRLGHEVLTPFSYNRRYDYVIDLGDRFLRAQCKTGRLAHGAVEFSKVSVRCSRTSIHRRAYGSEIDLFLVFCPALDRVYAISAAEAQAGVSVLRVDPPRNAQVRGINWARDYILGVGERALAALPTPPRLTLAAVPE